MDDHTHVAMTRTTVGQCERTDRDDPPAPITAPACWCGVVVTPDGTATEAEAAARYRDAAASPTFAGQSGEDRLREEVRRKMAGPGRPDSGFVPGSSNHRPPPPGAATADDVAAMYQAKLREAAGEATERRRTRYFR